MEEELLRARKLESLGVLAGGIAHDFNNFLTIVQGNIEVAKAKLGLGQPVQEILDQTTGACQLAALLSLQLLTLDTLASRRDTRPAPPVLRGRMNFVSARRLAGSGSGGDTLAWQV